MEVLRWYEYERELDEEKTVRTWGVYL